MHSPFGFSAAVAAVLSVTAGANPISTCADGASDVCFAVGVPSTTASSTSGNIYMQISAPTTYSWVSLGSGSMQMAGSNMFILYTDGKGNVTVSSRQGTGNVQPQYKASTASDVQLMSGSGVSNGKMVANILCTNCKSWSGGTLSTTSTSSWIAAWKSGSALDSADPAESIAYHDAHSSFSLDLTKATMSSDSNPFTAAATTPTSSGGSNTTGGASSTGVTQSASPSRAVIAAHGVGMALVFAVLYPIGSAIMPLLGKWKVHAGFQVITWLGMWAFFGLGVYGAKQRFLLFNNTHTLLGTVVVCLLAIQPALGQLHHQQYLKTGGRTIVSYVHLYWGRILLLLGVINGGLGLQLTRSRGRFVVAYSVISAIMYVLYAGVKVFTWRRKSRENTVSREAGKMSPRSGHVEHGDEVPMNDYSRRHAK